MKRKFCAYFWFNGWSNINLGITISLYCPNIEIHVPFGFFRIGWVIVDSAAAYVRTPTVRIRKAIGYDPL